MPIPSKLYYEILKLSLEKKWPFISTLLCRCGFVGESEPRVIIPSVAKCKDKSKESFLYEFTSKKDLNSVLINFFHKIFFK